MFCLRSWLPLLLIPCNAPPAFTLTFFILTFIANRPCLYCSLLLITIFATSTYWAPAPFLPLTGNWFVPPLVAKAGNQTGAYGNDTLAFMLDVAGATVSTLGDAAIDQVRNAVLGGNATTQQRNGWIAAAFNWVRMLNAKEWRIPCVDVVVRL